MDFIRCVVRSFRWGFVVCCCYRYTPQRGRAGFEPFLLWECNGGFFFFLFSVYITDYNNNYRRSSASVQSAGGGAGNPAPGWSARHTTGNGRTGPAPVSGSPAFSFIFRTLFRSGFGWVVWSVSVTVILHEEEGRAFEPFLLQECNGVVFLFFFFSVYIPDQKKNSISRPEKDVPKPCIPSRGKLVFRLQL